MKRWREMAGLACLALVAVLPFLGALQADFVEWDDDINVTQNSRVQGLDAGRLKWMFGTAEYAMRYKPLNWLAWAVIYEVQGLRPFGFHLANLVLHGANAVLLFLVLRRMLGLAEVSGVRRCGAVAVNVAGAMGALLWAWNPLRVEPVAWVTGLPYGLAVFFVLAAWWAYLGAGAEGVRKPGYYWGSVGLYLLAALTFPIVVVFVAVLVAVDVAVLGRFRGVEGGWLGAAARRVWWEKLPFLVVAVGLMVPTLVGRLGSKGTHLYEGAVGLGEYGVFRRVMQAFYVWAYYAWKPWLPTDLAAVYPTLLGFDPMNGPFVGSALLVVVVTVGLIRLRGRWPGVLAVWLAYLAVTVPVLGLTEFPHYPSDRYAHLPNLAWAVTVAFGLGAAWARVQVRGVGLAVVGGATLVWGALSFWQTPVWNNSISLFEGTLEALRGSVYAGDIAWRLGGLHARAGNVERAGQCFELYRATRWPSVRGDVLAAAYWLEREKLEEAEYHAEAALRLKVDDVSAMNVLAIVSFRRGNWLRAQELFRASLMVEERQPQIWERLAEALERLGKVADAASARERGRMVGRSGPTDGFKSGR